MVSEDTISTSVYTNSYLSHRTVQYGGHSSGVAQRTHTTIPASVAELPHGHRLGVE